MNTHSVWLYFSSVVTVTLWNSAKCAVGVVFYSKHLEFTVNIFVVPFFDHYGWFKNFKQTEKKWCLLSFPHANPNLCSTSLHKCNSIWETATAPLSKFELMSTDKKKHYTYEEHKFIFLCEIAHVCNFMGNHPWSTVCQHQHRIQCKCAKSGKKWAMSTLKVFSWPYDSLRLHFVKHLLLRPHMAFFGW